MAGRDLIRKRAGQMRRYYQRRAAAIAQLGGKCSATGCGATDDLEFDHLDPNQKEFDVSAALATWSEERLQHELAKCRLLCGRHHKQRHGVGRGQTHGTDSCYRRGCRCEPCRQAHSVVTRAYAEKRAIASGKMPRRLRPEPEHGTRPRYLRGCRCDPCKAAQATYQREWRAA